MSFAPARSNLPSFVEGSLVFTDRGPEKPYAYAIRLPEGVPQNNIVTTPHIVRVANAREAAEPFALDVHGFEIVGHKTAVRDFWDEAQTLALGHPETAELVKRVTGAARVVVFDHTLRRRLEGANDRTPGVVRQPASRVHVDQTVTSGPQRVRDLLGDEAEGLLSHRAAIINVWRPIARPARDWPRAVADARSVARDDLIASDLIFEHRRGEIYSVAYNPDQHWWYVPDLATDEAILIKCWDSEETVARFAPHTGFEDPTTPEGTPLRESIELRTIAFFD